MKRHKCKICGEGFRYPREVRRHHSDIHEPGETHDCPIPECDRTFKRKDNMLRHQRKHTASLSGASSVPSMSDPSPSGLPTVSTDSSQAFEDCFGSLQPEALNSGEACVDPRLTLLDASCLTHSSQAFEDCFGSPQPEALNSSEASVDPCLT